MHRDRSYAFLCFAALALACSGGGSGGSNPPPTPSLEVDPTEWSVYAGGAPKQFTATLTGASDPIVWAVETAGTADEVGTLSATGLYGPPASLAAGRDVVLKATAGALVARATVHVGAAVGGVTIAVTPATGAVVAGSGDTVALHAATNYVGTVSWTLVPDLGTLDAATGTDVTFTAPAGLVIATTAVAVTATAGAVSDATTIAVRPTVLHVTGPATVRAGGAPVAFVLATDVGASPVAWSVVPTSAGTIAGTGSVGTFTPASSVVADTPFEVVATVGEATGRASSTVLEQVVAPGSVAGRVVDERGVGYAGARVVIGSSSALTGADGAFTIASVSVPYDATVIAESNKTVTVFRGVSDPTPVLPFTRTVLGTRRSVMISGTVKYEGTGMYADVFGPEDRTTSLPPDGAWAFGALNPSHWSGDATATITHRATLVGTNPATQLPEGYAYGARSTAVTDGGTVTGQDIVLALLASGNVSGTVTSGADHDLLTYAFSVGAAFDGGLSISLARLTVNDPSVPYGPFTISAPVLPDGHARLTARAGGVAGGSAKASAPVTPGQSGVALALPSIPVAIAPAPAPPRFGYTTPLSWTSAEAGGTGAVEIDCNNGVSYRIWGGGRSATIPDLSAHGVVMVSGYAVCTWYPRWVSYGIADLVNGPAAVDALAVERTAIGADLSFIF